MRQGTIDTLAAAAVAAREVPFVPPTNHYTLLKVYQTGVMSAAPPPGGAIGSGSAPAPAGPTTSTAAGTGSAPPGAGSALPAHIRAATGLSAQALGFTPSPSFMSLSTWPEQYRMWDHFLRVLGNPNELSDRENRLIAVQAICSTANVFVEASYAPIVKRKAGATPTPASASPPAPVAKPTVPTAAPTTAAGASHAAAVAAAKLKAKATAAAAAANAANASSKDDKDDKDDSVGQIQRKYLPQSNTLLHVFAPWLFEAVQCVPLDDAHPFAQAKSAAYKTLCGMCVSAALDDMMSVM